MKGCCNGCGHYRELDKGQCRECLHPGKQKKKPTPLRFKPRKKSGDWEFFLAIWPLRVHRCINCKMKLGDIPKPEFFSHIKGKGANPEKEIRFDPNNIQILCPKCHTLFDQGTFEQYNRRKNLHA